MNEATIDAGASRAVIGTDKLKRLMAGLPVEVRRKVMKGPTHGIVFKFGNLGRLTSDFAIMLPRSQKGWLGVEVVKGQALFFGFQCCFEGNKGD